MKKQILLRLIPSILAVKLLIWSPQKSSDYRENSLNATERLH